MIQVGKPTKMVFAAAFIATALVGSALAEMVYDDEATQNSKSNMQPAGNASQEMSAAPTNSVEVKNVITTTETVSTAPVIAEAPQKASEKYREKRGFQESMNNELVVQKLEDRRLKQEEKLTAEINKRFTLEDEPAGSAAPVMKEEKVVKPINETSASYEMSAAPKGATLESKAIVQDQLAVYQSSTTMSPAPVMSAKSEASIDLDDEKKSTSGRRMSVIPRGGASWISNSNYNFNSRFSVGGALAFDASDNLAVELGYTYSQYGVRIGQSAMGYSTMFQAQELRFKNNSFDATMKLYLTGRQAFVRPFIGGGFGYSVGYVNYDNTTQQYMQYYPPAMREDYKLSQFQGILQGGLDFKVADNIFVGAMYKYVTPLSSTESQGGLNTTAFYPYQGYAMDPQKQALRGTFRDSNIGYFLVSAGFQF
jgi:opacity protein-like surface antigen